jgi:hypothetical protein
MNQYDGMAVSGIPYYDSTTCTNNTITILPIESRAKGRKKNHPTVEQRRQWREEAFRRARCR